MAKFTNNRENINVKQHYQSKIAKEKVTEDELKDVPKVVPEDESKDAYQKEPDENKKAKRNPRTIDAKNQNI